MHEDLGEKKNKKQTTIFRKLEIISQGAIKSEENFSFSYFVVTKILSY